MNTLTKFVRALAFGCVLAGSVSAAAAQETSLPRLVKLVVPWSAGSNTDIMARTVASALGQRMGTQVVVENRAGASGIIGAEAVVHGPRDGSMVMFTSLSTLTAAAAMAKVPFDAVNDLVPVSMIAEGYMLVAVSAKTDIRTPAELVAAAKAQPNALSYGSGGIGTLQHLGAELLQDAAGIRMVHVPYKGGAPALLDLAAGNIDVMIGVHSTMAAQIKSGRVRLIGVGSPGPSAAFPDLIPMATVAPGFESSVWQGVFAPAGTPKEVLLRLNRELNAIAQSPELRGQLQSDGASPGNLSLEQFGARVQDSYAAWRKLTTSKKIVID